MNTFTTFVEITIAFRIACYKDIRCRKAIEKSQCTKWTTSIIVIYQSGPSWRIGITSLNHRMLYHCGKLVLVIYYIHYSIQSLFLAHKRIIYQHNLEHYNDVLQLPLNPFQTGIYYEEIFFLYYMHSDMLMYVQISKHTLVCDPPWKG